MQDPGGQGKRGSLVQFGRGGMRGWIKEVKGEDGEALLRDGVEGRS